MDEKSHMQPLAWVIVYRDTGEPAHDDFFDDLERAEALAKMLRMTTAREIEVSRALL